MIDHLPSCLYLVYQLYVTPISFPKLLISQVFIIPSWYHSLCFSTCINFFSLPRHQAFNGENSKLYRRRSSNKKVSRDFRWIWQGRECEVLFPRRKSRREDARVVQRDDIFCYPWIIKFPCFLPWCQEWELWSLDFQFKIIYHGRD